MSPREAIEILDNVGARVVGNREDHARIQSSLTVLNGLVVKFEQEAQAERTVDGAEVNESTRDSSKPRTR